MALKIPFLKALRSNPRFKRFFFTILHSASGRPTEAENNFKIPNSRSAMIASEAINLWFTPDSSCERVFRPLPTIALSFPRMSVDFSTFLRKKIKTFCKSPNRTALSHFFFYFCQKYSVSTQFAVPLSGGAEKFFQQRKIRNNKLSGTPAFNEVSHCTRISQHSIMTIRQSTNCVVLITAEAVAAQVLSLSFTIFLLLLRRIFFLLLLEENH